MAVKQANTFFFGQSGSVQFVTELSVFGGRENQKKNNQSDKFLSPKKEIMNGSLLIFFQIETRFNQFLHFIYLFINKLTKEIYILKQKTIIA